MVLEPRDVEIVRASATFVTAKTTPPNGDPNIDVFEAGVVGGTSEQKCDIKATADPLQCEVPNLSPNTAYTVTVTACMPDAAGCGAAVPKATLTLPNRMINDSKIVLVIRL